MGNCKCIFINVFLSVINVSCKGTSDEEDEHDDEEDDFEDEKSSIETHDFCHEIQTRSSLNNLMDRNEIQTRSSLNNLHDRHAGG